MKLKIIYKTIYSYQSLLIESLNEVRLYPIKNSQQNPLEFYINLSPRATTQHYRNFFVIELTFLKSTTRTKS